MARIVYTDDPNYVPNDRKRLLEQHAKNGIDFLE